MSDGELSQVVVPGWLDTVTLNGCDSPTFGMDVYISARKARTMICRSWD